MHDHSVLNLCTKTYRLVVGIGSIYLALGDDPESIEDASRKHSGVLCCFCFFISIYLAVLKRVVRFFKITKMNRLWLTQIFLYCFYEACIPKLILRLGSGVDCVETNPAPIVTYFDVSYTISAPYSQGSTV